MVRICSTFFLIIGLSAGCAYFNTFYLAKKNFNDAELQRSRDRGSIVLETQKKYDAAIDWAYEILDRYPDSKYVDDSVYIIGMSSYYQKKYYEARIKFDELLSAFPESEFVPTAQYYKALCLIELGYGADARIILLELMNTPNRSMNGPAGLALAEMSFAEGDWDELLSAAQRVIDLDPEKNDLFKAMYYMGEALYQTERYEESTQLLEGLEREKLDPELRFKINSLIAQSEGELGNYQKAMTYLESMENRGDFVDYAPRIRLEIGKIYELQGEDELAADTYRNMAGDFPDSLSAKEGWYRVGVLLIKDLSQAEEAKNAFDMVKEGRATTNELWFIEAQNKSVQIDSLLAKLDQIERLERDYNRSRGIPVDEPEAVQADSAAVLKTSADSLVSDMNETGILNAVADVIAVTAVESGIDSLSLTEDVSDSVSVPEDDSVSPEQMADEKSQTDNIALALARVRFSLAELYTYSFDRPDSAITHYRLIIEETPGSEFAIKGEYFTKSYELQQSGVFSEETETTLMREIIEKYPTSEFSHTLRVFLGIIETPPDIGVLADAELSRMTDRNAEVYIPLFEAVIDGFPGTKSAYQARFYMAYIYEHDVGDIEKAFEIYRELTEDEPTINSEVYINLAKEKLEYAEQEEKKLAEVKESIAYYELRIHEIETGVSLAKRVGSTDAGVQGTSGDADGGYTGFRKIRARNARIRSRYYTD